MARHWLASLKSGATLLLLLGVPVSRQWRINIPRFCMTMECNSINHKYSMVPNLRYIGWPKLQASRKLHALTIITAWDTSRIFEVLYLKYAASIPCNYTLIITFSYQSCPFQQSKLALWKFTLQSKFIIIILGKFIMYNNWCWDPQNIRNKLHRGIIDVCSPPWGMGVNILL